jgi:hypothetical protein
MDITRTVRFGDDEPIIEFSSESYAASVPISRVGDRLYRLDGVSMAESAE